MAISKSGWPSSILLDQGHRGSGSPILQHFTVFDRFFSLFRPPVPHPGIDICPDERIPASRSYSPVAGLIWKNVPDTPRRQSPRDNQRNSCSSARCAPWDFFARVFVWFTVRVLRLLPDAGGWPPDAPLPDTCPAPKIRLLPRLRAQHVCIATCSRLASSLRGSSFRFPASSPWPGLQLTALLIAAVCRR